MFHYRSLLPIASSSSRMMRFAPIWRRENTECDRTLSNETQIQSATFGVESATIGSLQKIAMDPVISKLLDEIPEKPPRSKLEVHADVIATLRQKRRTYCEIAEFFREHLAITVSPSTIHDFVRVRRRRGKRNVASDNQPKTSAPKDVASPPVKGTSPNNDDMHRKIAAMKRRTPVEPPRLIFDYDPNEPLKLRRKPGSGDTD
jgi:hypothetical protein